MYVCVGIQEGASGGYIGEAGGRKWKGVGGRRNYSLILKITKRKPSLQFIGLFVHWMIWDLGS